MRNDEARYNNWLKEAKEIGIPNLTQNNSDLLIQHIEDMEAGRNISRKSKTGRRGYSTLNTRKSWLIVIFKNLEKRGIKDITEITERQIHDFFDDVKKGVVKQQNGKAYGKSIRDQIKAFRAFWNWYMKAQRKLYNETNGKKGMLVMDITEELSADKNGDNFVYFTLEQLKKMMPYFSEDEQVRLLFMFDTIIRSPTELMNVKVSDLHDDFEQLTIRDEITKTYERTIKLLLCSDELKKYIKTNELKQDDYLFTFSPSNFNKKLKQVAEKVLGTGISKGGERYDKISLYDFRHSGACHWRLGAYKTKIDALMYRGGWSNLSTLNYYTKKIGMRDSIEKTDLLIDVDRTELERVKEENSALLKKVYKLGKDIKKIAVKRIKSDEILDALTKDPDSLKLIAEALGRLGLVDKVMKI
ncbi:MAG: tyrosine-type recombinase/integrase [Planctomycetota bacterium]